jgi:hypothetical protein
MPQSPRLRWPYPTENQDPWYGGFKDLLEAMDNSVFAAMEDRNTFVMGGGTMAFNAGTGVLSWSADVEVNSPFTGFRHVLAAGSLVVPDLSVAYAALSRNLTANAVLTLAAAASMPGGAAAETFFVLCLRRGTRLYFRNGDVLADGDSKELLSSDGAGGVGAVGQKIRESVAVALYHAADAAGVSAVGNFEFNPEDYELDGTTLTVKFSAVAYVSGSGVAGTVVLYDLTASSTAATLSFTGSDLAPVKKLSTSLSLSAANHMYEVRISRTSGSTTADRLLLRWAGFEVDRTV